MMLKLLSRSELSEVDSGGADKRLGVAPGPGLKNRAVRRDHSQRKIEMSRGVASLFPTGPGFFFANGSEKVRRTDSKEREKDSVVMRNSHREL